MKWGKVTGDLGITVDLLRMETTLYVKIVLRLPQNFKVSLA